MATLELDDKESLVLRDILDLEIESFEAARDMPDGEAPKNLEDLLEHAGSFDEVIVALKRIRRKVSHE